MVTTKQKTIGNTQKIKRREHKHTIKKVIKPQRIRSREEERNREELQKQPENN